MFPIIDGARLADDGTVPVDPADGRGGVVLNATAIGCAPDGGVVRTTATSSVHGPGSFGHRETTSVTTTTDTLTIAVGFASALTGPVYFDQFAVNGQVVYDRYPAPGGSGGYVMNDVTVGGTIVGAISDDETFEMWYGTRKQPVSPIMASIYGSDPYPAHRGIAYIVWTGPITSIPTFNVLARNDRSLASEIITARLTMVGWDGVTPLIDSDRLNICLGDDERHLRGVFQLNSGSPRPTCEQVLSVCNSQFAEVDGKIITVSMKTPPTVTISSDELGAHDAGSDSNSFNTVKVTPVDVTQIPSSYEIGFFNIDTLDNDTAPSVWPGATHTNPVKVDYGIVASKPEMLRTAAIQHALLRNADATFEIAVPIDRLKDIIPGTLCQDVPLLQGGTIDGIVDKMVLSNFLSLTCKRWSAAAFTESPTTIVITPPSPPPVVPSLGTLIGFLSDAVPYKDTMAGAFSGYMVAAVSVQTGETFPGGAISYHMGPAPALSHATALNTQSCMGTLVGALGSPASSVFDYDHPQQIQLYNEAFALASVTGATRALREAFALDSRANLMLAENGCYFQFTEAEDLGDGLYEVTGIRAYRYGSDYLSSVPDETKVVRIFDEDGLESTAIGLPDYRPADVTKTIEYRFIPGIYAPGTGASTVYTKTLDGNSYKPLAPVFLQNTPSAGLILSWIDRSRYPEQSAAWWSGASPASSDDSDFHVLVEVLGIDRIALPQQHVVGANSLTLSSGQMTFIFTDTFGEPVPSHFDGHIYQLSKWLSTGGGYGHGGAYSNFT
jgi:hypothetical protein